MRLRWTLVLSFVSILCVAGPARPSAAADHVQIVTHTAGIAGSIWESDLEIRAEGAVPAEVRVDLLGRDRDNTTPLATTTVVVPAGTTSRLVDLVEGTFGLTFTTGALRLTTLAGLASFASRTANRGGFSSYGFDIPAEPDSDAIGYGTTGRLIHLTGNSDRRTNLGFVNLTGMSIAVAADLYRADGTFLRTVAVALAPYDMQQSFNIFTTGDVDDGYALLSTSTPGGGFLAHAIVVDNASGDWVWLPASAAAGLPRAGDGITQTAYVPLVRRTLDGQDLTGWTDLELKAGPNGGATVQLELLVSGQPNPTPASAFVNVPIGESLRLHDVLGSVLGASGSGALRLTVTSGWLEAADSITSRVDGGSVWSRYVPAMSTTEAFGADGSAMVLDLSRDADHGSAIGLLNLWPSPSTARVTVLDQAGRAVDHATLALGAWEPLELDDVLAALPSPASGTVLVSASQRFVAYGAVTELSSGDTGFAAAVDTPLLFVDGFESGDTGAW